MPVIADLVMLLWPFAVFAIFSFAPPSRAVVIAFVTGWLFLPFEHYSFRGLPDLSKMTLTCISIFFAAIVLDYKRLLRFRVRKVDLLAGLFCLAPSISSLTNDLGLWDAVSNLNKMLLVWGLPYFLGRVYLTKHEDLRFACVAIVVGTLIYLPLCWYEIRMSPQLHNIVYGSHHRWSTMRLGGWRPTVFLDSGLQLAMWMTFASLISIWMWWTRGWQRIFGMNAILPMLAIAITTVFCKSLGALLLLIFGLCALGITWFLKTRIALIGLLLIPIVYIGVRVSGDIGTETVLSFAQKIDEDRAGSLGFRFKNEDILLEKALERPLFGWGGWGRSRVRDDEGRDISVTDGLWIIELGQQGFLGLTLYFVLLLMPLAALVYSFKPGRLMTAEFAPTLSLAIAINLFAIDCLLNAMPSPIYLVIIGGLHSAILSTDQKACVVEPKLVARTTWPNTGRQNSLTANNLRSIQKS